MGGDVAEDGRGQGVVDGLGMSVGGQGSRDDATACADLSEGREETGRARTRHMARVKALVCVMYREGGRDGWWEGVGFGNSGEM